VVGGFWCKTQGLLRILGFFGDFWRVYNLFVNSFWKLKALVKFLQTPEDYGEIFDKYRGFNTNL
jgi:hypothetical protein